MAAVERFGWWDWPRPPQSESEVHQLSTVREAASRLRLVRRRGRRLHTTTHGTDLLHNAGRLWELVSTETEDGEEFTRTVTELVGLRLVQGGVERDKLTAEIGPILAAQGWSSSTGAITVDQVFFAIWRLLRCWRIFGVLEEVESKWEPGTGRRPTSHTLELLPDGERMVLAYLRSRAAGPRHRLHE